MKLCFVLLALSLPILAVASEAPALQPGLYISKDKSAQDSVLGVSRDGQTLIWGKQVKMKWNGEVFQRERHPGNNAYIQVTGANRLAVVFQVIRGGIVKGTLASNYYLSGTDPERKNECTEETIGQTCGDVITDQFWGPRRGSCVAVDMCLYGG